MNQIQTDTLTRDTPPPGDGGLPEFSYYPAQPDTPLVEATVGQVLSERARAHPARIALVARTADGEDSSLSYAELYDQARRTAAAILRLAEPGERVALIAPNLQEWAVIQYGAALAGVVLVAVNPAFRVPEMAHVLRDSAAVLIIHAETSRGQNLTALLGEIVPEIDTVRTVVSLSDRQRWQCASDVDVDEGRFGPFSRDSAAPVMLQYTSGTTGMPKGVLLRHRSVLNNAKLTLEAVGAEEGFIGLNPLPMFHTASCGIGTLSTLWFGGTEVLLPEFSGAGALDIMEREGVNTLFYVPTVLAAMVESAKQRREVPQLQRIVGGASTLSVGLHAAATATFGAEVFNLYGQTELSPVATLVRAGDSAHDATHTVGRALPHTEVKIVDPESGHTLPVGVAGEVYVRGYSQMVGYLNRSGPEGRVPGESDWVPTGDQGSMDERGYLTLTGRLKDLIIRGGENISPAEIESRLTEHPRVLQAAVVGVPDDHWGEVVVAALVLRGDPEAEPALAEELRSFCKSALASYKAPTRWFATEELPMTVSGKVQKHVLLEHITAGAIGEFS